MRSRATPAPWQDWCGAPSRKGKAQGAGPERAPEGALLCRQYLQHLPLEPRALRAWRAGPQCMARRLLSSCDVWKVCSLTLLTGQNSVTVTAATICGVSPGARHWLCILRISNSLGVAWSGGTGIVDPGLPDCKAPIFLVTQPPPLPALSSITPETGHTPSSSGSPKASSETQAWGLTS